MILQLLIWLCTWHVAWGVNNELKEDQPKKKRSDSLLKESITKYSTNHLSGDRNTIVIATRNLYPKLPFVPEESASKSEKQKYRLANVFESKTIKHSDSLIKESIAKYLQNHLGDDANTRVTMTRSNYPKAPFVQNYKSIYKQNKLANDAKPGKHEARQNKIDQTVFEKEIKTSANNQLRGNITKYSNYHFSGNKERSSNAYPGYPSQIRDAVGRYVMEFLSQPSVGDRIKRSSVKKAECQKAHKENGTFVNGEISNNIYQDKNYDDDTLKWLKLVKNSKNGINRNGKDFYNAWIDMLSILEDKAEILPQISIKKSLEYMETTDLFMNLFWPFRLDVNRFYQEVGLYGMSDEEKESNVKTRFFEALEKLQRIPIPCKEKNIVLSFNHPDLIDGLNRSNLIAYSRHFIQNGKHRFTEYERKEITYQTNASLRLIRKTSLILYEAITQMVATIAFYKAETPGYLGGSVSSAIGVIWLDPSAGEKWSVSFYAEQIVYEFIHTSLFYAEFLYGMYSNNYLIAKAKALSAIRQQLRGFDKSFHAAYVSTGLITFHTKAGFLRRAEELARTLVVSVDDLDRVNRKIGVLDKSGNALLSFLLNYLTLTRIGKE